MYIRDLGNGKAIKAFRQVIKKQGMFDDTVSVFAPDDTVDKNQCTENEQGKGKFYPINVPGFAQCQSIGIGW
ncbi:hypothetical protein D3C87_1437830 [compost metagenome]